jgi:hypothetical protein
MAKRYSVASPSTGTGGANVLYAGGGRVGGGGIPKAAPGGFSIDLGLDKMRQKTEDDEKRKYLISGGLDPKAVALMDTQSLEMGVRAMSDDLIRAKEKELEVSNANLIGELFKNMGRITTESAFGGSDLGGESGVGKGHGEVTGEPASDWADREFETTEGLASAEDLQDTIAEEDDLAKMPDDLFNPLDALKPPKSKPVDAISALIQDFPSHLLTKEIYAKARQAKMDVTPKEVDPWANAKGMMVGNDWVDFGRDGKELRRIKDLPKDIDWQEIKVYLKDGREGSFFRDKNDPNIYKMDGKDIKFYPVPMGASRSRPRSEKSLSMKFNAFLETNKDYKGIVETHKVNGKKVLLDPKDLYINGSGPEQAAAIEFFNTRDGTVALIEAITELQKARNKGDEARRTKIQKLIDNFPNKEAK